MSSATPTYRIEFAPARHPFNGRVYHQTVGCWQGRASQKRLDEFMESFINSMKPGGVNEHQAVDGWLPVPAAASIVRQSTGEVVATWEHPAFLAV